MVYEVKNVTSRYNKHNNPDKLESFSWVNQSSTRNERILLSRARLINNTEGLSNGELTTNPKTRILDKAMSKTIAEETARKKETKEFNEMRTNIKASDKKLRSGGLKFDMRESLQSIRFNNEASKLQKIGSKSMCKIPSNF